MLAVVKRVFSKHPLIANCAVYGTLYVGAEFSQQTVNKKFLCEGSTEPEYDKAVLARYGLLGVALYPPVYFYCMIVPCAVANQMTEKTDIRVTARYRWLDRRFVGTALPIVARKLLLDQFLLTPPLLVIFYVSMSVMERKKDLLEECRNKLLPTFKSSCMFWLPAQSLNFLLVPPAARVVYVGSCAFVWVNILCWFKRQSY